MPVELREQFNADDAQARFRLRYRLCPPGQDKGPWIELPEHIGTRLKPLKLAAYQLALREGVQHPEGERKIDTEGHCNV